MIVVSPNQERRTEKGKHPGIAITACFGVRMVGKPTKHQRQPEPGNPGWDIPEQPDQLSVAENCANEEYREVAKGYRPGRSPGLWTTKFSHLPHPGRQAVRNQAS